MEESSGEKTAGVSRSYLEMTTITKISWCYLIMCELCLCLINVPFLLSFHEHKITRHYMHLDYSLYTKAHVLAYFILI